MFADDTILYIENPKDATRKVLELTNEFGKVAGYKINAQKSLAFLYPNDEKSEREIKEKYLENLEKKEINCKSVCVMVKPLHASLHHIKNV